MEIEVIIEDPKGSTVRHVRDDATGGWREYPHPRAQSPWPADYGFIPNTRNPADDDEIDVIIISMESHATGDRIVAIVVGWLPRPDGDHKILALPRDDPAFGQRRHWRQLPPAALVPIERWFREWTTFDGWQGPDQATELIERSRVPRAER